MQNKLVAGTNITIDDTNPASPIISATGGGTSDVDKAYVDAQDQAVLTSSNDYTDFQYYELPSTITGLIGAESQESIRNAVGGVDGMLEICQAIADQRIPVLKVIDDSNSSTMVCTSSDSLISEQSNFFRITLSGATLCVELIVNYDISANEFGNSTTYKTPTQYDPMSQSYNTPMYKPYELNARIIELKNESTSDQIKAVFTNNDFGAVVDSIQEASGLVIKGESTNIFPYNLVKYDGWDIGIFIKTSDFDREYRFKRDSWTGNNLSLTVIDNSSTTEQNKELLILRTSNWVQNIIMGDDTIITDIYSNEVEVPSITSTDTFYITSYAPQGSMDILEYQQYINTFNKMQLVADNKNAEVGKAKFYCMGEMPTTDMPIMLIVGGQLK